MTRLLAVLGFVAFAVGATLTYMLFSEPFGRAFTLGLVLCILGTLVLLVTMGIEVLRAHRVSLRLLAVVPLALAATLALLTAVVAMDARVLFFRGLPPDPSPAEWQEDLDFLAEQMVALHPDLFSLVPKERFDSAVAATRAKIPMLSDGQTLMELFRIVALPNDAHTYPFLFLPVYDVHVFPVQAYWFDDGLYVVRAGREYRGTVGSRVVAVAGLAIEEVYERFRPYVAAENEFGGLDRWSGLPIAEWLVSEGLAEDGRAEVTLARPDGNLYDVTVRAIGLIQFGYWTYMRRVDNTFSPAVSNDRRQAFRFEYDEDTHSLYFDFNQSLMRWGDDNLEQVLAELDAFLAEHPCERFILDLRNNGGGDLAAARAVVDFVAGDEAIDRRGSLFVLIGRRTFSAGVSAAAMLRNNTGAILIGEPTGQGPAYYAGPRLVTLPNSRLPVAISTRRTVSTPFDAAQDRIEPDVRVGYTHDDFLNGRDPLREAALTYEVPTIATADVSLSMLGGYVGRYRFSPYQALDVTLDRGRLRLAIDDFLRGSVSTARTTLHPISETTFVTEIPGVGVSFAPDRQDASSVLVEWNGGWRSAPRLPPGYRFPLELFSQGAIDDGVAGVLADSAHYATAVPGLESDINRMGYDYLREGDAVAAIAVFQLNVALFPESSNTYDSLGEGYMVHGDTALAVKNYRRSLELDPENDNAREMLRRMGARE